MAPRTFAAPTSTPPGSFAAPESPYETTAEDFQVHHIPCPCCAGPMTTINWVQPDEARRQNVFQPAAAFGHRFGALYLHNRRERPCRRCLIRAEAQRTTGRYIVHAGIVDPALKALQDLKHASNPPKPPADCMPEGSLFLGGLLFVSAKAAQTLGYTIPGAPTGGDHEIVLAERGRTEVIPPYLALHGSDANVPKLDADALEVIHTRGPFATIEEQNAVAVGAGIGTIRSRHPLWQAPPRGTGKIDAYGRPTDPTDQLHIWTELGDPNSRDEANRVPITLAYVGGDGVQID